MLSTITPRHAVGRVGRLHLFALAWFFCSLCEAQVPKAIITGPKESPVGDLVILDASQSQGLGYLWLLVNSDKSFLPVDNGVRCVFASGTPGKFMFVLIVSGTNANGGPAAATAQHTLSIAGAQPPAPPEPKPPDPPQPPTVKATSAVILLETGELTSDQAMVLNTLRNDPLSKSVKILDRDAKTTAGAPLPQAVAALKYVGQRPLPQVVAVEPGGEFSAVAELPKSAKELIEILKLWGIKP